MRPIEVVGLERVQVYAIGELGQQVGARLPRRLRPRLDVGARRQSELDPELAVHGMLDDHVDDPNAEVDERVELVDGVFGPVSNGHTDRACSTVGARR